MFRHTNICLMTTLAAGIALTGCGDTDAANALIGSKKTAQDLEVKMQLKGLGDAMFVQNTSPGGVWPTSLEELVSDGTVKMSDITDPWGNDFQYTPPSTTSDENPVLYSFGPDGEPETADDIHHQWP